MTQDDVIHVICCLGIGLTVGSSFFLPTTVPGSAQGE